MRLSVIIPVYGQAHYTDRVLDDLYLDNGIECGFDKVYLVDNRGDHQQRYGEVVLKQDENIGWCRGTNVGLFEAYNWDCDAFICMNNDVRLSPNFIDGIRLALQARPLAGLLAPLYDDVWPQQRNWFQGKAADFQPEEIERPVEFVDGTCMVIPRRTLDTVGFLDEVHFGQFGWGADFDYAIRIREVGGQIMVTHRAYLNHVHQGTAKKTYANFEGLAGNEMETGMQLKYGANWRSLIE